MTLKQLQLRRDLLQNVVSQSIRVENDLAAVDARIAEHSAALSEATKERDQLVKKLAAVREARAELPKLKADLAEALAAAERAKRQTVKA